MSAGSVTRWGRHGNQEEESEAPGDVAVGDWVWYTDDPTSYYAATANSAGQVLMQLCDLEDGNCVYAVGFETRCDEGDTHPALVNTDQSAASIELHCGKRLDDGSNLMLVGDFDQLDGILRKASRIGFALPMQGDEFKAIRFSLKGSVTALDRMRRLAASGDAARPDVRNTRDSEVF